MSLSGILRQILSFLYVPFVVVLFIAFGTSNIVILKLQNESVVKGPGSSPPQSFSHAVFQTLQMFLGQLLFLISYVPREIFCRASSPQRALREMERLADDNPLVQDGSQTPESATMQKDRLNPLFFCLSASCDVFKSFLFLGLIFTYASVSEMLKPFVIVFTGFLALLFLRATIWPHQYLGITLVLIGSITVALSSTIFNPASRAGLARNPALGALFVLIGKFADACAITLQERFMKGFRCGPDECLAWEGIWGTCLTFFVLIALYFIPGSDYGSIESFPAAFIQVFAGGSVSLTILTFGCILSLGLYHFFGILISKHKSSLSRVVFDTVRAVLIWAIQIARKRDSFSWMQLAGFIVIVLGNLVYADIVYVPVYRAWFLRSKRRKEEKERLKRQKAEERPEDYVLIRPEERTTRQRFMARNPFED